jgi:hypothetical protein
MVPETGAKRDRMTLDGAMKTIKRKDDVLRRVKEWLNAYDPTACLNDLVDKALADALPERQDGIPELRCGVYQHYKGGFYLLIGIGQHTEDESIHVVYVPLTGAHQPGPRLRIRPIYDFIDSVKVKGVPVPRFEYVGYEVQSERVKDL